MENVGDESVSLDPQILFGVKYHQYLDRLSYAPRNVDVLDIVQFENGLVEFDSKSLSPDQLETWLDATLLPHPGHSSHIRIRGALRLLLGPSAPNSVPIEDLPMNFPDDIHKIVRPHELPFSKPHFELVLEKWNLPKATPWLCCTGTGHVQRYRLDNDDRSIGLTMRRTSRGILAIDIALSLSHCIETRSTYALLLGRSNLQAAFIRQQVEELAKIAHHPAFLPTLVCSYHRTLLQKLSDSLNNDLFNVETDSGQTWTPIYNPRGFRRPGDCDDANITKRALGVIQLATAWEAYAKAVLCNIETIRDFMRYATSLVPEHRRSYVQLEDEIFHERLRFLEGKDKTVLWRFEYLKERAQAQQSAIYNYISLKNNETNSSLARDSRELAEASMRESYAMKSISVITMVFLPGTFVATLFATPAIAQAFPPQWAYWLVTIVLTLSVMGLWTGWYRWTTAQIAAATRARDMTRADVKNGRGTK